MTFLTGEDKINNFGIIPNDDLAGSAGNYNLPYIEDFVAGSTGTSGSILPMSETSTGGGSVAKIDGELGHDGIIRYNVKTPALGFGDSTYTGNSFSVASEGASNSIRFKDDGTKMYMIGSSAEAVYEYDLGTARDITTAVYNSNFFDVSSEDTTPLFVTFKDDGTKMYLMWSDTDTVYEYDLGTAWDVTSAVYNSSSFDVSSEAGITRSLAFKDDGTKMYVLGGFTQLVFEYDLGTAWDVTSAVYNGNSFDISNEDGIPLDITFAENDTEMYMVGNNTDKIYKYNLSTAWDITSASYSGISLDISSEDAVPQWIAFKNDKTKMYMVGVISDSLYEYDVQNNTPGDFISHNTLKDSIVLGVGRRESITYRIRFNELSDTESDYDIVFGFLSDETQITQTNGVYWKMSFDTYADSEFRIVSSDNGTDSENINTNQSIVGGDWYDFTIVVDGTSASFYIKDVTNDTPVELIGTLTTNIPSNPLHMGLNMERISTGTVTEINVDGDKVVYFNFSN